MFEDLLTRFWNHLITRPFGPLSLRFLLQPAVAIVLAVRSGLKDYRAGKSAYFWAIFVEPEHRRELLRDGWKSIGKIFIAAVVLDCIYQVLELHWIYPGEALVIAVLLAIIPYLLVRGPVNRIASIARRSPARAPQGSSAAKKAGV